LWDTTGLAPGPLVGGRRTGFGCLGIPSPRTTVGWWAWSSTATAGLDSITFIDSHRQVGSADPVASSQPGSVRTSRHLHHVVVVGVEAADLMVTQPVEHQGEEFAGCCHLGDVVSAPNRVEVAAAFGAPRHLHQQGHRLPNTNPRWLPSPPPHPSRPPTPPRPASEASYRTVSTTTACLPRRGTPPKNNDDADQYPHKLSSGASSH
jgi:hypothetical protein